MRIGQLAGRLGLNPKTVRFYEEIGVMPTPARAAPSGYRDYTEADVERLQFIKRAQTIGFSLDEIREVLAFRDRGEAPCPYVRQQLGAKAAAIDEQLAELERLRAELDRLAARAAEFDDDPGDCFCHVIDGEGRYGTSPNEASRNEFDIPAEWKP